MNKRYLLYGLIIIICILALGSGIYEWIYGNGTESIFDKQEKIAEHEEQLKQNFNDLFTNTLIYENGSINSSIYRKDKSKDLIYTSNQLNETVNGKYEMNINVPELNIVSNVADQINNDIEEQFLKIARNILKSDSSSYTIYNIDYAGFVSSDIVSLVIKANLKEGNTPQRTMYKTYNYNTRNKYFS